MLVVEALNAAFGDALLLSWTDAAGEVRTALVDGGPDRTYATLLEPRLLSISGGGRPAAAGTLEFVCVSHIDDDHIGGIARLLQRLRRDRRDGRPSLVTIHRLWHNRWDQLGRVEPVLDPRRLPAVAPGDDPGGYAASVAQGRDVRDIARLLGLDANRPFGGPLTAGGHAVVAGLDVTVVGPGQKELDALLTLWETAEREKPGEVLAAAYRDRKIQNLSSIVLLVSDGTRRALLTGDARDDHVLANLVALGLLQDGPLHLDVLKLPHHGSKGNASQAFFAQVTADHYIVSADGVTHGLPDLETLTWLADARGNDEYVIHLTNPMPRVEAHLAALRAGRRFRVEVRAAEAPSVRI